MLDGAKSFFYVSCGIAILLWSVCLVHGHFVSIDYVSDVKNTAMQRLFK